MAKQYEARVWLSDGERFEFAENSPLGGNLRDRTTNSGVCFSGGGTRALTAGMGQLRGLIDSIPLVGRCRKPDLNTLSALERRDRGTDRGTPTLFDERNLWFGHADRKHHGNLEM